MVVSGLMPSFTLFPVGNERSVMSLHFPGENIFGMIPIRFIWMSGMVPTGNGPRILPLATSELRYLVIISGCSLVLVRFCRAD